MCQKRKHQEERKRKKQKEQKAGEQQTHRTNEKIGGRVGPKGPQWSSQLKELVVRRLHLVVHGGGSGRGRGAVQRRRRRIHKLRGSSSRR